LSEYYLPTAHVQVLKQIAVSAAAEIAVLEHMDEHQLENGTTSTQGLVFVCAAGHVVV
jgi:hypothetical protein